MVEVGFGCRGDEGEGFGVDCGAVEEFADGAVGHCLGGYGEYGDEVGEVLLDEGCVEAETTVGEVHCVPVMLNHIRRALLDTPQSVRNGRERQLLRGSFSSYCRPVSPTRPISRPRIRATDGGKEGYDVYSFFYQIHFN